MKVKRPLRVRVQGFVGWCRDVRAVRECKSILRANLDRNYDKDDSLRTLTVVTVNALYRARHQPPNNFVTNVLPATALIVGGTG